MYNHVWASSAPKCQQNTICWLPSGLTTCNSNIPEQGRRHQHTHDRIFVQEPRVWSRMQCLLILLVKSFKELKNIHHALSYTNTEAGKKGIAALWQLCLYVAITEREVGRWCMRQTSEEFNIISNKPPQGTVKGESATAPPSADVK